jgi:hypothetical protein
MNTEKTEVVICACFSPEHQFLYTKSDDEVYIHPHLVKKSLWYRLKYGVRYILGRKSRYGAWDEIILDGSHAEQFQDIANHLLELKAKEVIGAQ